MHGGRQNLRVLKAATLEAFEGEKCFREWNTLVRGLFIFKKSTQNTSVYQDG